MKPLEATRPNPRYALRPWQVKFGAVLADMDTPSIAAQEEIASRLAGVPITYGQIKVLRRRADFRELVETMRSGGIEAARRLFVSDLPLYAELFRWGAERSKAKDDTRGLAAYAVPALDRIMPRRDDFLLALQQQTVVVNLSPKQMEIEQSGPLEVTCSAIPSAPHEAAPLADPPRALPPGTQTAGEAFAEARRKSTPSRPWDD